MRDIDWIVKHSFRNCHAMGVDSILLQENPTIRFFVARNEHELYHNMTGHWFSVGFHPHHTDVKFRVMVGNPLNVSMNQLHGEGPWRMYRWLSPIRGEEGKFVVMGEASRIEPIFRNLQGLSLPAREFHTVFVERGRKAVWEVQEGAEDIHYQALCMSNNDLTQWSAKGMYLPIEKELVEYYLKEYGYV